MYLPYNEVGDGFTEIMSLTRKMNIGFTDYIQVTYISEDSLFLLINGQRKLKMIQIQLMESNHSTHVTIPKFIYHTLISTEYSTRIFINKWG